MTARIAKAASVDKTSANWSLLELKLAIMFLRSLYRTGLEPVAAFEELANLQPKKADFWRAAARHARTGKPLYAYLDGRWPETLVAPIRIAELSGRLEEVFHGMQESLQQQIDARDVLKKLYYPVGIMVGGLAAAIFMITYVIPSMIGNMRFERGEPGIVIFTKAAQALITQYGWMALGIIIAMGVLLVWKWREDDSLKEATFAIINKVPVVGWATRWIWFAVWARYVSVMIRADILFTDILKTTENTLPPHLRGALTSIGQNLHRGQTMTQAATPSTNQDDPRHQLPIHIINAFRMTDRNGQGDIQFAVANETLFEPGQKILEAAIGTIKHIATLVSAALVTIPFILYLQTIGTLTRTMGH